MAAVAPLVGKARTSVELGTRRLNVWEGSVRSGKTVASMLAWTAFVLHGPAGNLMMVGKTERTLRRNIIDPLIEWLGPTRCRLIAGTGELWICGRRIYLVGANDERAQEKIRGITLVGVYVDEASLVPESFWSMLLSRLSAPGARLYATTNPDNPSHWLLRDYLSRACVWLTGTGEVITRDLPGLDQASDAADVLDLARFSFRLADNPNLDPGYVASLMREYVGLWYRRFVLGEWVVAEGAVYDMWDPARHVVGPGRAADLPRIDRWLGLGVDHGTANPFAALMLGLGTDPTDRVTRLYLTSEWRYESRRHRRQLTDVEYSTRLRGWLASHPRPGEREVGVRPEWVYVDPSAAGFIRQMYADGLAPAGAVNDVLLGIQLVSSLLGADRLRVHESCTGWIEEVTGYCWDPDAQEKGEDKPIKVGDHSLDGGRYVVASTEPLWRPHLVLAA